MKNNTGVKQLLVINETRYKHYQTDNSIFQKAHMANYRFKERALFVSPLSIQLDVFLSFKKNVHSTFEYIKNIFAILDCCQQYNGNRENWLRYSI